MSLIKINNSTISYLTYGNGAIITIYPKDINNILTTDNFKTLIDEIRKSDPNVEQVTLIPNLNKHSENDKDYDRMVNIIEERLIKIREELG